MNQPLPAALLCGLLSLTVSPAAAELTSNEVAILAVRSSPASQEIAAYYAERRNIPREHIFLLGVEPGKDITRGQWETSVRPAIRRWLIDQQLETQIRCLVTVWDVPLRISAQPDGTYDDSIRYLEAEQRTRVARTVEVLQQMRRLAGETEEPKPPGPTENAARLSQQFARLTEQTRQHMLARQTHDDDPLAREFFELVQQAHGIRGRMAIVRTANPDGSPHLPGVRMRNLSEGERSGLTAGIRALESLPTSLQRDEQLLLLVEQLEGLIGSVQWIEQKLAAYRKNESQASFDSELSLLFWPQYPLLRWQANHLHFQYDQSPLRHVRPTLMVSRLEAPTIELTKGLVDAALRVEADGLTGKIYLDARGPAKPAGTKYQRGMVPDYDRTLHQLYELLRTATPDQVVLNADGELFQAGECPQTALYCGWYSLGKYVPAFAFQPGAVAYHVASSEAVTLRAPASQVWCKRLLEEGVAATLGPTFEPYLLAFPRADEFFTALLSGRYCLAEAYYRTKPFNSWAMVLVGDPLYRPFRRGSPLDLEKLPARLRPVVGLPLQPAQPAALGD